MNEPAFPCDLTMYDEEVKVKYQGMTLRDYFAAKAMQAILSKDPDYHQRYEFLDLADFSYRCADAMLKERQE